MLNSHSNRVTNTFFHFFFYSITNIDLEKGCMETINVNTLLCNSRVNKLNYVVAIIFVPSNDVK